MVPAPFIPADQTDRELYLLDLKPDSFRDGKGVRRQRKPLRRTGTRRCFAIDDLYTTRFEGTESNELERVFFGEVDSLGKQAVEFFSHFDHDRVSGKKLENLMLYMSTQKLRTPKGLDWLVAQAGVRRRADVLDQLTTLRSLYGAIWAECVWQIADASGAEANFIVSDHPVTVYNRSCAPGNPLWCKGANDPDIRLQATHTLFPLSSARLLTSAPGCAKHHPATSSLRCLVFAREGERLRRSGRTRRLSQQSRGVPPRSPRRSRSTRSRPRRR